MKFEATAKYLRTSTRKMRLVADAIRNLSVARALAQLAAMPKAAAGDLKKVLESAVANAKGRNSAIADLSIEKIEVMGGPSMKRWHAASRGMAHPFKKRMTHVRIVVSDEHTKDTNVQKEVKE